MKFLKENWFKIIIATAILIVASSIGYYVISIPKQYVRTASIDSQSKCAIQAKKVFDTFKTVSGIDTYNYGYHYDNNGTCYVLVHGFGEGGQEDALINAYENETLAQCESYAGVSNINFCEYNGIQTEKYDISKFDDFVKQYMEN